jgi:hypothetical protein
MDIMTRSADTSIRTLRIVPRAAGLDLSSEDAPLRARWSGPTPRIRDRGLLTEVGYTAGARLRALATRHGRLGLTLDRRTPLALEIAGGVSGLSAELRELDLRELVVTGGATHVTLDLPAPTRDLPVRIEGGASRVTVRRPAGVPVSVAIDGGATGLEIDEERLGPMGGQVCAEAAGDGPAIRLRVRGGASDLRVEAAAVRELAYAL